MKNLIRKYRTNIFISLLLLAGFLIRVYLTDKSNIADILVYAEWGQKLAQFGPKDFYTRIDWYYSPPVYPPIAELLFGGLSYLFDHKYVLAQLHNLTKFPPAIFITYFYKSGYFLLLKLPGILADLGLSLFVYKILLNLTHDVKKSIVGLSLFLFNPLTIFLSAVWGQTDGIVALFASLSFLFIYKKNAWLSFPLMFLSLYFKPAWAMLIPFYLFLIYLQRPKLKSMIMGVIISFLIFAVSTISFANGNLFGFTWDLFTKKMQWSVGTIGKASNSAFNFQTIFFKIDIDYASIKFLGIPTNIIGIAFYIFTNILAFVFVKREKVSLISVIAGLFTIGMGSFLFMASMLERYFFPAFAPMIILMIARPKMLFNLVIMNLILFANIIWSYFRRMSDEIGNPFTNNNFLVIRILSIVQVVMYLSVLKMIQFESEHNFRRTSRSN